MFDFIKKYKITIIVIILIVIIIGTYIGIRLYRLNTGEYSPNNSPQGDVIKDYEINRYIVIRKEKVDVYNEYYKNFMIALANDPMKAFNMLTTETKQAVFNSNYNDFVEYQKELDKNILLTSEITQYSVKNNKITVVDKYGKMFVFYENGVWNYTVEMYK